MGLYDRSGFGMMPQTTSGPTVGSLEDAILMEHRLSRYEKEKALQQLRRDLGGVPRSTPLMDVVSRIGGGVLGMIVAQFMSMGTIGQILTTMAGYGLGKAVGDFYNGQNDDDINWVR